MTSIVNSLKIFSKTLAFHKFSTTCQAICNKGQIRQCDTKVIRTYYTKYFICEISVRLLAIFKRKICTNWRDITNKIDDKRKFLIMGLWVRKMKAYYIKNCVLNTILLTYVSTSLPLLMFVGHYNIDYFWDTWLVAAVLYVIQSQLWKYKMQLVAASCNRSFIGGCNFWWMI